MRRGWAAARSARMMRDDGTLLRPTLADDGAGGTTPGDPTQTAVTGMFWSLSGEELIRAAQLGQVGRYRLALPIATDIRETDQIVLFDTLYNVVWAPPVAALDAERIVGLEESGQPAPDIDTGGGVLIDAYTWIGIRAIPTYAEDVTA